MAAECGKLADRRGFQIVTIASCLAPPEAAACIATAAQKRGGGTFVLGTLIDGIFLAYSPLWWELRRDAWASNFSMPRVTIEGDEGSISVYLLTAGWIPDMIDILDGGLVIPADCCFIVHRDAPV